MKTKDKAKKKRNYSESGITAEKFVSAWQKASSLAHAAETLGTSVLAARARAYQYRKRGIPLQKFVGVRGAQPLDVAALSKLARRRSPQSARRSSLRTNCLDSLRSVMVFASDGREHRTDADSGSQKSIRRGDEAGDGRRHHTCGLAQAAGAGGDWGGRARQESGEEIGGRQPIQGAPRGWRPLRPLAPCWCGPESETIAHGLSNLNRYGGHTRRPLSVAEHSLWCAVYLACDGADNELFRTRADGVANNKPLEWVWTMHPRLALLALIDDAPEGCGLVDVPGPVLRHHEMTEYKFAHVRCYDWLSRGWGIVLPTNEEHELVKAVDTSILGAEMAVRPVGTARDGGGENLPEWAGSDLAGRHDLSRLGPAYVRDVRARAFHLLMERAR